ncbi:MAG: HAMP domain-containing histidine kinase [Deltaproteobacteria bacterium]|nr:HAMP domain-containing histidine kinase [Deltaproteobacteria bacterium]
MANRGRLNSMPMQALQAAPQRWWSSSSAKRRGVRIVVEPGDGPLTVECDAEQLQQVFINLAVNAFDAMAPSGGTLRVSSEIEHKADHRAILKLTFEDNGAGVPEQFQQHVFDSFFTTKPPGKGTGMGLSVSQAIIYDHNGDISFDSKPGGTHFYVRVPWPRKTLLLTPTAMHDWSAQFDRTAGNNSGSRR